MNIALWIVQALLALAFGAAGAMKLATPVDELVANGMTYAAHVPVWVTKLAGASEVVGAVGLILPAALRIKPILTPMAAAGLVTVMLGAIATHVILGEWGALGGPVVLGVMAAFVAWGRFTARPIVPRSDAAASAA